ncbi:MAG: hypothetical protein SynsKO_15380 [Synoicihabitans sp.]
MLPANLEFPSPVAKSKPQRSESASVALKQFIGQDLIGALGRLGADAVMGPWRNSHPHERRGERAFKSALYGDDHAHDHAELCLLLEGRCRFSLAQRGAILECGDLVVCPAGVAHAEAFVTRQTDYRLVWWSLNNNDPSVHVTRYSGQEGFTFDHRMSLTALPAEPRRRLARLREWAAGGHAVPIDGLREALLTLALALFRRAIDGGNAPMDTREVVVQRAIAFVQSHGDRALSLAEVAGEVHVSPNYLTSLFRSVTGKSLGRFIADERMQRACSVLAETELTIKEVADQLGFADAYAFSRTFKTFSGQSPSQWRESRRT